MILKYLDFGFDLVLDFWSLLPFDNDNAQKGSKLGKNWSYLNEKARKRKLMKLGFFVQLIIISSCEISFVTLKFESLSDFSQLGIIRLIPWDKLSLLLSLRYLCLKKYCKINVKMFGQYNPLCWYVNLSRFKFIFTSTCDTCHMHALLTAFDLYHNVKTKV